MLDVALNRRARCRWTYELPILLVLVDWYLQRRKFRPSSLLVLGKVFAWESKVSRAPGYNDRKKQEIQRAKSSHLRTRHTQSLTESLPPHSAHVLEAFYDICACAFCFSFFESAVPVATFNVHLPFFGLFVLSFPLVQLFFACS